MRKIESIADLGYYMDEKKEYLMNDRTRDGMRMTNRHFSELNWSFRGLPKKLITEYIRQLDRPVRILDVGGGGLSQSANDIAAMFGDKVHVVNVDLVASQEGIGEHVSPVVASMLNLPFQDNSFDLVTSFYAIPVLSDQETREPKILSEISRVLNDGGTALLHEEHYSYPEYFDSVLPADGFGTRITIKDRALNLNWRRRLERFNAPDRISPSRYMVMQKGTQLPSIEKVIASVPNKLKSWQTQ